MMIKKKGRAAMSLEAKAWGLCLWLAAAAAACGQTNTTESGETHFLLTCESQTCGAGLQCLCGVCSRPCSGDEACDGLGRDVTCVEHDADRCTTVTKSCDLSCEGDDACRHLGAGYRCDAGFCRKGPRPEPQTEQACGGGCGASECATPGACSLEAACAVVDCGGILVDDNACVRPSCETDESCPAEQRCTSLWLSHHTACMESNGTCNCEAGLGLFPTHVCSPVTLAGPRGAWTSLKLTRASFSAETEYTIYPDGRLELSETEANMPPVNSLGQLSPTDLERLERSVNGPSLRLALSDGTTCGSVTDVGASVTLELDTTSLEKDVSGCVFGGDSNNPYNELFDLVASY